MCPNVFRNDALKYEFDAIETAIRQRPYDFRECASDFEILTKLQHYGLGTRLLDVTLNPLVALYFASEKCEEYQCHPSYATIGKAVGMSNNTVRKYVQELEERGLIRTERTSIITRDGRKQNGSLLYTILPIQFSIGEFYQRQMDAVDRAKERQRVARRMEQTSV